MLYARNPSNVLHTLTMILVVGASLAPPLTIDAHGGLHDESAAQPQQSQATTRRTSGQPDTVASAQAPDEPPFHAYKGVRIGMSAAEARQKLGSAQEKSDAQDFYVFSEKESAQVFYDGARKVSAIAITFLGEESGAPTAKAVLGMEVEAKPDGSVYKLERYPKAGYWVSYSRTGGDTNLVAVTMQKIN